MEDELEAARKKLRSFELVSDALKSKPVENHCIKNYVDLVKNDFTKFCGKESGLNALVQENKLWSIQHEMRLIANCPDIHSKTIGAIGGGFSSGKSSFVNSFMKDAAVRLPEGINPVTAIPSYVVCAEESQIKGFTYKGGCFDISPAMYKSISHEFLQSFTFDLNEIIFYTTVSCPINPELFSNLCIIDTPGYNPPSSGTAKHDFATAKEYIKNAQFLIWMIGLDANGTIPSSDISFLNELDFGKPDGRLLYIIANKAELKKQDDIEDILDTFEETLEDADLEYAGISAYSSKRKQIYGQRKTDIVEFLKQQNVPSRKFDDLSPLLEAVFEEYRAEIRRDDQEKQAKRKEVKSMLLDAFEHGTIGIDESSSKLEEGLTNLERYFKPEQLEERLALTDTVFGKFKQCLFGFCDEMGIDRNVSPLKKPAANEAAANEAAGKNDTGRAFQNLFGNDSNSALAKLMKSAGSSGETIRPDEAAMVPVPAGTFSMGSTNGVDNEKPVHQVTISKPFHIGKYPVTQKEWTAVMGSNPSYLEGDTLPVEQVSWFDAVEYCNKRSQKEGLTPAYTRNGDTVTWNTSAAGYRLPTEAEWEWAAKGGGKDTVITEYSGSNNADTVAWYRDNSGARTHAVGTKAPNSLGVYDMSGSVWEWCWDWFGAYSSGSQTDPMGAASGSDRVLRGGSWIDNAAYLRSAIRIGNTSANRGYNLGFRVVRP